MAKKVVDLRGKQPLFKMQPERSSARPTQKRMPLRARRRRARSLAGVVIFVLIVIAGGGIHFLSYMPQYSISTINVTGTELEDPSLIQGSVDRLIHDDSNHFFSRANIFTYPKAEIVRALSVDFPRIGSATVSRTSLFSQTLDVSVTERQPFALWCATVDDCYEMDESGYIFAEGSEASSTMYIFQDGFASSTASVATSSAVAAAAEAISPQAGSTVLTTGTSSPIGQQYVPAHLPGILALLQDFGQAGVTPRGAIVENDEDFSVPLAEGFTVKASFGESADMLSRNLQLILSSESLQGKLNDLEYIDLRFGNRVYYKFKGYDQVSTP